MSVYHGTKFGFVQSAVYDQMGVSLEGRLANASDINLCDAYSIGETNGIGVGLGVTLSAISGAIKPGINSEQAKLPTTSSLASDFAGILVRTDTGRTDANGRNYMAEKEMGTVLRKSRVGGRIWVKAYNAITAGSNLYWIIANRVNSAQPVGGFAGSAITGTVGGVSVTDTVQLTEVRVISSAAAGELALIEMDVAPNASVDLSSYETSAHAAATYQPKLTAGSNVAISDENVISATDTTYTAGTGIEISAENVISTTNG